MLLCLCRCPSLSVCMFFWLLNVNYFMGEYFKCFKFAFFCIFHSYNKLCMMKSMHCSSGLIHCVVWYML